MSSGRAADLKNGNGGMRRREWLKSVGAAGGGLLLGAGLARSSGLPQAQSSQTSPDFTGPEANPHWNSIGPIVSEPQKAPMLLLTDRPVQLDNQPHSTVEEGQGSGTPKKTRKPLLLLRLFGLLLLR